MKQVLTGLFLALVSLTTMAQDLIVTQEGDSLNCKILKERNGYIYAAYMKDGQAKRNYFYPALLKDIQRGFYTATSIPSDATIEFGKTHIGIRSGWGHRLAPIADPNPAKQSYLKELQNGWVYSGHIDYFIQESLGLGIVTNVFKSRNTIAGYLVKSDPKLYTAIVNNRHTIWYIGPSLSYQRLSTNKQHSLIFRYSLGYIHYNNTESISISTYEFEEALNGGTLGYYIDVNYSYFFNLHFGIHANIALISGIPNSFTLKDDWGHKTQTTALEQDEYAGVRHVDIAVGLVFVL